MRIVLSLLLAAVPLLSQTTAPVRPTTWKAIKFPPLKQVQIPKVEEATLPNGMKVYLLENHELPLISGFALVRTGNLFDPKDKVGLASVTGNAIRAGGTKTKTGDEIDEQLENIAASVESRIGEGYGTISFSTLKNRQDEVLGVFRDVITQPAFRQDKIDLIKTQIKSGISRRNDDARGIAQREFSDMLYGRDTPYGSEVEYETLNRIQRADVISFYERYYFPANIILAIQGDFDSKAMKASLETLFANWTVQKPPVPPFPKAQDKGKPGVYFATKTDVTQTNFVLGSMGGLLNEKDYPALEVMADILGGGFRSRLFQKVRTQLGYAYDISANWGAGFDSPGLFQIAGSTKSKTTTEAMQAAEKELRKIRTEMVSAEELETAKQTVANSFVFDFDTPTKTLNRLVTYRFYGYPDNFIFDYQKAILKVTQADILRVAKERLDPDKMVIVAVGNPKEFGAPLSALGRPVNELDISIPEPKVPAPPQDEASVAKGQALLAKMLQAMGGQKLSQIQDAEWKQEMQVAPSAGGLKASQTVFWARPASYRQENVLPFGKIISYAGPEGGWLSTPQGMLPLQEAQKQQIDLELFRNWFLLPGKAKASISKEGTLLLSDGKLTVTWTLGSDGLPVKSNYQLAGAEIEEKFSDWREVSGVKLPFKVSLTQNGKPYLEQTVQSVKLNGGLKLEELAKRP